MFAVLAVLTPAANADPPTPESAAAHTAPTESAAAETPVAETPAAEKFDLVPGQAVGRIDRVTVGLEVGGHLLNPSNPADRTSEIDKAPMSVRGSLAYDERRLTDHRSARYYHTAEATIKIGARSKSPRLTDGRKLIVADSDTEHVRLLAPGGPLTRDQLDLVDVIGATLGIDAILPTRPLAEGEEWSVDGPAMGRLLGLDSVGMCEVTALIDDTNARYARFQMAGSVHGTIDGAATEVDLRGIGLFSLEKRRLTQLNLAIREDRKVGPATPGFQGVAKARIKIAPITASPQIAALELTDEKLALLTDEKLEPAEPLIAEAERQGFRFEHDRQWFSAGDDRRSLMLRRVEGVDLAAQATFTVGDESRPLSLPDFERQVRASLGDGLESLASSEQWTNAAGCRCLGIVARGSVGGVPVEWRYYQAAPAASSRNGVAAGRRVTLAATIEPTSSAETAVEARRLIDSLKIVPPKKVSTAKRRVSRRKR